MCKYITVGKVGRVYGVNGWVWVYSYTEPKERILSYVPLYFDDQKIINLEASKLHGKELIVKLFGIDTREIAKVYANQKISIKSEQLPQLAPDEYYWSDLVGLTVINKNGVPLGKIDHLIATGANDVLVIKNGKKMLLPYISQVVLAVDLKKHHAGRMG